jgi:hypothetical protein
MDVQVRIIRACLPFKKDPAFKDLALNNPDAYGPFWIAATLIFAMASCSNIASWLEFHEDGDVSSNTWAYDFTRVASALTMVYSYVLGLPLVLWAIGKYWRMPLPLTFLVCLYGYSLTLFIPVMCICTAPSDAVDWVILMLTMAWTLSFLLMNVWDHVSANLSQEKLLPLVAFMG